MDGQGMKFKHTYMSKDKMKKSGEGAFDSKFKSYVTDGESALKDKIMGTASREDVMRDVRRNLFEQMQEANKLSSDEATQMQDAHRTLRNQMQEALAKAKEATRQKKLLEAKMYAEKSKQSKHNAEVSEVELNNMIVQQQESAEKDVEKGVGSDGLATATDFDHKMQDIEYMRQLKKQAEANKATVHQKNIFSLFRAIGKKMERNGIEDQKKKQEDIIAEQKSILRTKTKEWNEIRRKRYETDSYRKYYKQYDAAAARYRMMNRKGTDGAAPEKAVKEYVGEFDLQKLETSLDSLQENPYLNVRVEVKNKKAGRSNDEKDFIKTHTKMTLLGEADEDGYQKRYKLNSKNFTGYEASRQLRKDNPTALTERRAVVKEYKSAEELKLITEAKDAGGKFLYTEDNVEIMQAKQAKWFGAQRLNGVFLFGEFISTNRKVISGKKDASTIGLTNSWGRVAQKEAVRRAVLRAEIFRQINAKTIQHAMGYGAADTAGGEKIMKKLMKELDSLMYPVNSIIYDKMESDDSPESMVGTFFTQQEESEALHETMIAEHEEKILKGDTHTLPNEVEAGWENTLKTGTKEDKDKLSTAMKTKVAYDVIRQEQAGGVKFDLNDPASRATKVLTAIQDDHKALSDLALLLLSEDTVPEYWNIAKAICSELILTNFERKWKGTFDSRFNRVLAKNREATGQLMRIALIDELNANRSHFDPNNILGGLMPTRWKQFRENIEGKRGTAAYFQQKLVDGSLLSFANEIFTSFVDVVDAGDIYPAETLRMLQIGNTYTTAVTSAMDMGAIAEPGAYAISDLFGDSTYEAVTKEAEINKETGEVIKPAETETRHTSDDRRNVIGLVYTGAKNIMQLIKICNKFRKTKAKQAAEKQKKEPNYDPKSDLAYTDNCYYQLISSGLKFLLGIGTVVAKQVKLKEVKNILGWTKSLIGTYEEFVNYKKASYQVDRIKTTENSFTALNDKQQKDADDVEMLEVLKDNSQLQYGMACAKRKSREDKHNAVAGMVSNIGKSIINTVKSFVPGGDKNIVVKIVDAVWGTLMTGTRIVMDVVHDKLAKKANIAKMLGAKYRNVSSSVLDEVLRRETGIASSDYLTDLARIFMSIDTDVFMKEAKTDAEKKIGAQIAKTLFNNNAFNENTLKNMNVSKLMGVMGVKGNFHQILKHSLA